MVFKLKQFQRVSNDVKMAAYILVIFRSKHVEVMGRYDGTREKSISLSLHDITSSHNNYMLALQHFLRLNAVLSCLTFKKCALIGGNLNISESTHSGFPYPTYRAAQTVSPAPVCSSGASSHCYRRSPGTLSRCP